MAARTVTTMATKNDWQPQLRYSNNLDSMRYNYHISAPKLAGRTFATHFDLVSKTYPVFTTGEFVRLSDGGSRDSNTHRYLAVKDRAEVLRWLAAQRTEAK
jgi:hypothetical protein